MEEKIILLIENDPEDQELIMSIIDEVAPSAGCYAVPSARDAIELLDTGTLIPDLIFCSNTLPGSGTPDIIKIVRKNTALQNTALIVVTAFISEEEVGKLKNEGATGMLIKSAPSQMHNTIKKHFGHELLVPERIAC